MGYARTREPATTPPELPLEIERAYEATFNRAYRFELDRAQRLVRSIIETGEGFLHSRSATGQSITYDAGDLWTALTENEEPADMAPILGAIYSDGKPESLARAKKILNPLIEKFAEEHAEYMAAHAANLYLLSVLEEK